MPRKTAEFLLVRSGSLWQKEGAVGAHAADAGTGNRMAAARAVTPIVRKDVRTDFTFAHSEEG